MRAATAAALTGPVLSGYRTAPPSHTGAQYLRIGKAREEVEGGYRPAPRDPAEIKRQAPVGPVLKAGGGETSVCGARPIQAGPDGGPIDQWNGKNSSGSYCLNNWTDAISGTKVNDIVTPRGRAERVGVSARIAVIGGGRKGGAWSAPPCWLRADTFEWTCLRKRPGSAGKARRRQRVELGPRSTAGRNGRSQIARRVR